MKKIIAFILTILTLFSVAFCLTACENNDDKIVIGITDYEPLDYRDENNNWIGFDAELAVKVFTELGYKTEFQLIDWETKTLTLNSNEIDCIWNGMTITEELENNLLLSESYLSNTQYGVVKAENAANYKTLSDLNGKKVAVEAGSAAFNLVQNLSCTIADCSNQNAAVMEVAAGTSDIAIIDYLLAATVTKPGSDYYNKLVTVNLGFEKEQFAVGFRKSDTELQKKVNEKLSELKANGFISKLAAKYNISDAVV